jgi:hypothetical protein
VAGVAALGFAGREIYKDTRKSNLGKLAKRIA